MKIAVSSDWHGNLPKKLNRKAIENCDALLLAGDVFPSVLHWEYGVIGPVENYLKSLSDGGVSVYLTPGNHDFHLYNGWVEDHPEHEVPRGRISDLSNLPPYGPDILKEICGASLLIDEEVDLNGIRAYFTPWTPDFCGWAFMLPEDRLRSVYGKIPDGVDILVSHGPPRFGTIDTIRESGVPCGSQAFLDSILEKRPKQVFCGHIHTGNHEETLIGESRCFNVSLLDEYYEVRYPVKVIEWA